MIAPSSIIFEASICIIPVAMAVIDGPNLIERLFGIDAGIKSGFHTAMGLMHAGKTALGMGRPHGILARMLPVQKLRWIRQEQCGRANLAIMATHAW